jgi:hypothetical protein
LSPWRMPPGSNAHNGVLPSSPGWGPTAPVELHMADMFPFPAVCCSGKSRALFCYDCLVPFTPTPSLQLPFQLHIVTHAAERLTKATGVHAAVLCRGQVHLQRCVRSRPPTPAAADAFSGHLLPWLHVCVCVECCVSVCICAGRCTCCLQSRGAAAAGPHPLSGYVPV